ncbi:MAG TPA: hypothetical protein VER14_06775, partial [Phototrophicaceae bacterium]|nr:hypothetical protein [Phototrophicaceae bacterium]
MFWRMVMLGWWSPNAPIADVLHLLPLLQLLMGFEYRYDTCTTENVCYFFEAPISIYDSYFVSVYHLSFI